MEARVRYWKSYYMYALRNVEYLPRSPLINSPTGPSGLSVQKEHRKYLGDCISYLLLHYIINYPKT